MSLLIIKANKRKEVYESYAVMYAVEQAMTPKPKGLVITSVCDYANEENRISIKGLHHIQALGLQSI